MQNIDIFIIMILIIVVSIIIGLNIVSLIDRKISDISINIPPQPQNVVIKIDPAINDKFNIKVEQQETHKPESFKNIIEPYQINNNNRKDYTEKPYTAPERDLKINMIELDNDNIANINNPDPLDTIKYDPKSIIPEIVPNTVISKTATINDKPVEFNDVIPPTTYTINNQKMIPKEHFLICPNDSLNRKFAQGQNNLKPFPIACDQKSTLDIDPIDYYKKYYKPIRGNLEDPVVRGYNFGKYDEFFKPYQIYTKLWTKEDEVKHIPVPTGFTFANSPGDNVTSAV